MTTFSADQLAEVRNVIVREDAPLLKMPEDFPEWFQALSDDDRAEAISQATGVRGITIREW